MSKVKVALISTPDGTHIHAVYSDEMSDTQIEDSIAEEYGQRDILMDTDISSETVYES